MSGAGERLADADLRQFAADVIDLFLEYKIVHGYKQPDAAKQAILDVAKGSAAASLRARLAASEARVRELEGALRQAADWFGLSSWEFEQKWGKTLHDSGNQEWAAHLNVALRGAEGREGE